MLVTLQINNETITVSDDTTILKAARKLGILIPSLCYDQRLSVSGACFEKCRFEAIGIH